MRNAAPGRPVSMTVRPHLFPFRTQKLSSLVPKIVGWTRPVKIGRCRLLSSIRLLKPQPDGHAPLAQLVEQLTLNQWAQGSSPWRCTSKKTQDRKILRLFFFRERGCTSSAHRLHISLISRDIRASSAQPAFSCTKRKFFRRTITGQAPSVRLDSSAGRPQGSQDL